MQNRLLSAAKLAFLTWHSTATSGFAKKLETVQSQCCIMELPQLQGAVKAGGEGGSLRRPIFPAAPLSRQSNCFLESTLCRPRGEYFIIRSQNIMSTGSLSLPCLPQYPRCHARLMLLAMWQDGAIGGSRKRITKQEFLLCN